MCQLTDFSRSAEIDIVSETQKVQTIRLLRQARHNTVGHLSAVPVSPSRCQFESKENSKWLKILLVARRMSELKRHCWGKEGERISFPSVNTIFRFRICRTVVSLNQICGIFLTTSILNTWSLCLVTLPISLKQLSL